MSSVLGIEKSMFLVYAMARIRPKADWRALLLEQYEGEETVREKSSTKESTRPLLKDICNGAT